jgi:hypothetical protein
MAEENEDVFEPYGPTDPQRLITVFRSLVLFDELYLYMQATNIAVVDDFLQSLETDLLREYVEIERTPVQSAIFVSALSQMWIFSMYELLRTWRQRVNDLILIAKAGKVSTTPPAPEESEFNLSRDFRKRAIERALGDPQFQRNLTVHYEGVEPVFRLCESMRVTLAKHEVPKTKKNMIPSSPGYGRINMLCGALDFEIIHKDGSFSYSNRRDIADAFRSLEFDSC